jgi:hypothetical protein
MDECISKIREALDCWVVAVEVPSVEEFRRLLGRHDGNEHATFTIITWLVPFRAVAGIVYDSDKTWEETGLDREKIRGLAVVKSVMRLLDLASRAVPTEQLRLLKSQKDAIARREDELFAALRLRKEKHKLAHKRSTTATSLVACSGAATVPPASTRRFRVALSFPGERRSFVAQIAANLATAYGRTRVLYDQFHEAEFTQPDLDVYLPNLYRTNSDLICIFLCADYAKKRFCNLEWRFIRQLIASEEQGRIMFLSFDPIAAIPEIGILSGDGYVSIGSRTAEQIAALINERLAL